MDELLFAINEEGNDNIWDTIQKNAMNDRRIILNQDIDDNLMELICCSIIKWNQEDKDLPIEKRKKIYIYVNSCGGETMMGLQVIASIQTSITPVVTVGFSFCASMAGYILAAGDERICFPNTIVLLHDGGIEISSSTNKAKDIQNFYDELDNHMRQFWIDNTNMDEEFLDNISDREYYMLAQEAKERGIVDKIIGADCTLDEIL